MLNDKVTVCVEKELKDMLKEIARSKRKRMSDIVREALADYISMFTNQVTVRTLDRRLRLLEERVDRICLLYTSPSPRDRG